MFVAIAQAPDEPGRCRSRYVRHVELSEAARGDGNPTEVPPMSLNAPISSMRRSRPAVTLVLASLGVF